MTKIKFIELFLENHETICYGNNFYLLFMMFKVVINVKCGGNTLSYFTRNKIPTDKLSLSIYYGLSFSSEAPCIKMGYY